jgi:hypothetical protein
MMEPSQSSQLVFGVLRLVQPLHLDQPYGCKIRIAAYQTLRMQDDPCHHHETWLDLITISNVACVLFGCQFENPHRLGLSTYLTGEISPKPAPEISYISWLERNVITFTATKPTFVFRVAAFIVESQS